MNTSRKRARGWAVIAAATAVAWTGGAAAVTTTDFRSFDGTGANPNGGAANTELIRLFDPAYDDGFHAPRGSIDPLANPRTISNTVAAQSGQTPNSFGATNWLWQWGQFIDHDLSLNEASSSSPPEDFQPIQVPQGDLSDPFVAGGITQLPFIRVEAAPGTGTDIDNPRQQVNKLTSFIDASMVYGSSEAVANALRTEDGRMKTQEATFMSANGERTETLLPFASQVGTPFAPSPLFAAGDVRVNEQNGLTATHTLLVREHNRIADELDARIDANDSVLVAHMNQAIDAPDNGVENRGDFVYHAARSVVAAEIQSVTYNEFLPMLVGKGFTPDADVLGGGFGLEPYSGYDATVDPSVSNEFANAAFRVGHTLLSDQLHRQNDDGTSPGSISLANAFFNIGNIYNATAGTGEGVDSMLYGLGLGPAQELDTLVVDGVRNFLFPAATGGLDLASVNIARGRDVGLPGYNAARMALGLDPVDDFLTTGGALGITTDPVLAAMLELAYGSGNVDDVDLWVGGLAEDAVNGGMLGEVFNLIISDQFRRARNGDPFFYLAHLDFLMDLGFWPGNEASLSAIIMRNTDVTGMQLNAFLMPASAPVPEPAALMLMLAGIATLGLRRTRRPLPVCVA